MAKMYHINPMRQRHI